MRLREYLFSTALMSIALVSTNAGAPIVFDHDCRTVFACDARSIIEAKVSEPLPAAPSPLISQDKILGSAYYDTVNILRTNNSCSDFFGGPASVDIFNKLISRIRKDILPVDIAMRMSGPATHIHDARSEKHYRIFAKVSINSRSSFYRKHAGTWEATVPRIGTFEPNTKEARVLMLLHELGHAMKGSNGQWLLPDDGEDEGLSRTNSAKVEDVCNHQIQSLGKVSTMKDLGKYKDPDQQPFQPGRSEAQPEPPR